MIWLLDALVVLAVGAAILGGALVLRGFGGDARALDRRMNRGRPTRAASTPPTPLAALDRAVERLWPQLRRRVLATGAPVTPAQLLLASALAIAVTASLASQLGLPLLLSLALALLVGAALPSLALASLAARRRRDLLAQLPQAIELIARGLTAGHPVAVAMQAVGSEMPAPIGPEFTAVVAEVNFGRDRAAALRAMTERFPLAELRMFAAALEVTRETGGNLSEVLLKLAADMRATSHLRRKAQAITAEGRLSFWVISALPFVVVGAILLLRPGYYRDAAADPLFWPMMCAPPVLWIVGATAIWRMVNFRI